MINNSFNNSVIAVSIYVERGGGWRVAGWPNYLRSMVRDLTVGSIARGAVQPLVEELCPGLQSNMHLALASIY